MLKKLSYFIKMEHLNSIKSLNPLFTINIRFGHKKTNNYYKKKDIKLILCLFFMKIEEFYVLII